ncbi:MAG: FecR domain-containing protein [Planctomycetes bacterium]|nr:FecR domain-containing protein [Planctomycetota bacterium]
MNPEDLHRLIEEYRDGTISSADAGRLAEAIRADAALAAEVRRELAFSGHLGQALEEAGDEAFVRSFSERLSAERGGDEFMTAFHKRASSRRTRRIEAPRTSLVPFLIAAGFLLAILAAVVWQNSQTPATPVVRRDPVPPPPPEEPKIEVSVPPPAPEPPVKPPEEPRTVAPPRAVPEPPAKPPAPAPIPAPPPEKPKPAPLKPTEVAPSTAVAKLDRVHGEVFVALDGDRKAAKAGQDLQPGMSVVTGLTNSNASIVLADGTRIAVGSDATLREIAKGLKGTRVVLSLGTVTADVAKQPADQPLVFATPHGEARVLGTVLRLVVDPAWTRLEVKEGKVQLTREGKSAVVGAGQYAVAGPGAPPTARSLSPDEIVLLPQQAKITGAEWALGREPRSLSGLVLEAGATAFKVTDHVETRPSYATWTFFAPADKEYRIWIRAMSLEKGDPWNRDLVTIEPTRAAMSQKSPFFGSAPTTAWVVTGVATTPGFSWISGHGEEGKVEPPLVVKFNETGMQNLRIYVGHPWVRIDAIWLSAVQKSRPTAKQVPTLTEK